MELRFAHRRPPICLHHYSHFYFSSRRRHTRFYCDWSSDVCSSDLNVGTAPLPSKQFAAFPKPTRSTTFAFGRQLERSMGVPGFVMATLPVRFSTNGEIGGRSEERV